MRNGSLDSVGGKEYALSVNKNEATGITSSMSGAARQARSQLKLTPAQSKHLSHGLSSVHESSRQWEMASPKSPNLIQQKLEHMKEMGFVSTSGDKHKIKTGEKELSSMFRQRTQAISALKFPVKFGGQEPSFAKHAYDKSQPVLAQLPKDLDKLVGLGDKDSVNPLPPMSMVL